MDRRKTRPGEQVRVALEQAIALRFKQPGDFAEELSTDISTGGMFIRTPNPQPVGAVLEFELRLGNAQPPIAGKAQVAWIRRRSANGSQPIGMGVRFVEIGDESRHQITRLVGSRAALEASSGQTASEPTGLPEPAPLTVPALPQVPPTTREPTAAATQGDRGDSAVTPPVAAAAAAKPQRRRSRLPWILVTIALAVALAAAFWSRPKETSAPPEASLPTAPQPAPEPRSSADDRANGASAAQPDQVRAVLEWARAWSDQRVDDYLAAYSPRFVPPNGADRRSWQRHRRARILAPERIDVRLAFVELETTGPDSSRVRFVQAYESDAYSDVVRKVLELERRDGVWRILRETLEP